MSLSVPAPTLCTADAPDACNALIIISSQMFGDRAQTVDAITNVADDKR